MERQCKYCKHMLEIHHVTHHQKKCILNPINLQKIGNFLQENAYNRKKITSVSFKELCIAEKILTPYTITVRYGLGGWLETLYQLFIFCYEAGLIDFELADSTMYRLGYYNETISYNSEDLHDNYLALIDAIIMTCHYDIENNLIEGEELLLCQELIKEYDYACMGTTYYK